MITENDIRLAEKSIQKAKDLLAKGYDDYQDIQLLLYQLEDNRVEVSNFLRRFQKGYAQ